MTQAKPTLDTVLARITSRSASTLGLREGLPVYAQIKGAALLRA